MDRLAQRRPMPIQEHLRPLSSKSPLKQDSQLGMAFWSHKRSKRRIFMYKHHVKNKKVHKWDYSKLTRNRLNSDYTWQDNTSATNFDQVQTPTLCENSKKSKVSTSTATRKVHQRKCFSPTARLHDRLKSEVQHKITNNKRNFKVTNKLRLKSPVSDRTNQPAIQRLIPNKSSISLQKPTPAVSFKISKKKPKRPCQPITNRILTTIYGKELSLLLHSLKTSKGYFTRRKHPKASK